MTDNVISFPGRSGERQPPDVNDLLVKLDAVRGIVHMAAKVAIEANTDDLAHAGSALFLASEQLQAVRDAIELLL